MKASKSNVAPQATIIATPDNPTQDESVISDGDYSSTWTNTLSGTQVINFAFPSPVGMQYIAIGGSNVAQKTSVLIEQTVATVVSTVINDTDLSLPEGEVLVYEVNLTNVDNIKITIAGTGQIGISEIAMGDLYEIPRGEQAGYARAWSVPNIKPRSAAGLDNSPISLTYESRALKATLSIENNIMADYDSFYDWLRFITENTFYIIEDSDKTHSYACFNAMPDMTSAHGQTTKLGVSRINYDVYAKATSTI